MLCNFYECIHLITYFTFIDVFREHISHLAFFFSGQNILQIYAKYILYVRNVVKYM